MRGFPIKADPCRTHPAHFSYFVQCSPSQQGLIMKPSLALSLSLFCEPPWLFFWFATTTSHRHAVGHIILHHQIPGLPSTSVARISRGDAGIDEVTRSLCHVNVADARAFDPRDEQKVKTTIQSTVPSLIEFCCDWCDWYGW